MELKGRVGLVTGGATGIGRATVLRLAQDGVAGVAINYRASKKEAEIVAEEVRKLGAEALCVCADVKSDEQVRRMIQQIEKRFGRLDVLVNNAALVGGVPSNDLATVDEAAVLGDLNTKFLGYVRCARAAAPHMQKNGWGRIINIGGLAARTAGAIAGARNAAVAHLTKTLADMLGPFGITVNAIHPGTTRTERTAEAWTAAARREGTTLEEYEQRLAAHHAIRRIVDAREIAYVAAFLASPKSAAITGEVIAAGGGPSRAVYY